MRTFRLISLFFLGAFFIFTGVQHFLKPKTFESIVPGWVPSAYWAVVISGVAEIAGGLGLWIRPVRQAAGIGLIALLIAVFPANVNMAVNRLPIDGRDLPVWALWLRLPLQAVMIFWVWWAAVRGGE